MAACRDGGGESDTMNNCSTSVQVTVPEPVATTAPDLEVGSPSVSDNSPATGATITLSATVRNAGDGAAAATTLRCPAGAPRHRPRRRPHRTPTAIAPHANAVHRRLLAQRPVLAPFAVDQAADLCSCGHENDDSAAGLVCMSWTASGTRTTATWNA